MTERRASLSGNMSPGQVSAPPKLKSSVLKRGKSPITTRAPAPNRGGSPDITSVTVSAVSSTPQAQPATKDWRDFDDESSEEDLLDIEEKSDASALLRVGRTDLKAVTGATTPGRSDAEGSESETELSSPFAAMELAHLYRIMLESNFDHVGPHRHYDMISVHARFCQAISRQVEIGDIWDHLSSLYHLQGLGNALHPPAPKEPIVTRTNSWFRLPAHIQKIADELYPAHKEGEEDKVVFEEDSSLF